MKLHNFCLSWIFIVLVNTLDEWCTVDRITSQSHRPICVLIFE